MNMFHFRQNITKLVNQCSSEKCYDNDEKFIKTLLQKDCQWFRNNFSLKKVYAIYNECLLLLFGNSDKNQC